MIDELDAIRRSMDDVPGPSGDVLARLRTELDLLIAPPSRPALPAKRARWRSRRARIGVAVGVAAVAAVIAIAVLPSSTGGPAPAAAATALRKLAHVAAGQPAVVAPGPGQYQYTDSEDAYENCTSTLTPISTTTTVPIGSTGSVSAPAAPVSSSRNDYCVLVPEHRQIWIGADYSGRILESFGTPQFLSPADEAAWEASGSPLLGNSDSDVTFGPHALGDGPPGFSALPTDPTELARMISSRQIESGPPGPAEDFNQIGDLLRETDASPALRSALYQVAATIPGVELLGNVPNHAGTVGIGVAYTDDGVRNELIFDPTTSALLGEESVAIVADPSGYNVAAGTVLDWADYLSSGIVDSLSDTPTGTVSPAPPVSCTAVNPATLPAGSMKPVAGDQEAWPTICKPGTMP